MTRFKPGDTVHVRSGGTDTFASVLDEPKSPTARVKVLLWFMGGLVPAPGSWPTNTEAGSGGVLYNLWFIPHKLKYDQVVHAYGFGVTTWIWWLGLSAILVGRLSELTSSGSKVGRLSELTSSESVVGRISEPTRSDSQREGDEEREGREAGNKVGRISEPTRSDF